MLETVATFDNPLVAEMAKNMLVSRGIEAVLEDEQTVAMAWQLANAVGGVKLKVRIEDAGRARGALQGFDAKVSDDAVAGEPETAKHLAAAEAPEPFDDTPTDLAVDRVFRGAVVGLLFWPLQFLNLYYIACLWGAKPPVRREKRWKIAAALALNFPIWAVVWFAIVFPLMHAFNAFDPDAPHWNNRRFAGFGDHAMQLDFPNPFAFEPSEGQTPLGPVTSRNFSTVAGPEYYGVSINSFPLLADPPADLATLAGWLFRDHNYKVDSTTPLEIDGHPAIEVKARYKDATTQRIRLVHQKLIAFPPHIVLVSSDLPESRKESAIEKRFFASLKVE